MLGVVARAAPQINTFAIGPPVALGIGPPGLLMTLPAPSQPFAMTLERRLEQFR